QRRPRQEPCRIECRQGRIRIIDDQGNFRAAEYDGIAARILHPSDHADRRGYPGNCSVSGGSVPVCVVSKASDPEKHVNRLTYEGWSDGMLQDIERAQRARLTEHHRMAVLPR